MSGDQKIDIRLQNLESRVTALEKLLDGPKVSKKDNKTIKKLPDFVMSLRDSHFFKEPKTANEVQTKLSDTYHCEVDRVAMCLLRLADKRQLRKTHKAISGKDFLAYTW